MGRIRLRDAANTLRTIRQIRVRDANNVTQTIKRVRNRTAGNFIFTTYDLIVASVNPPFVSGSFTGSPPATANISTGSVQALVSGGVSPFTVAWTQAIPTAYTWTISAPTASATYFTAANVESGVYTEAQFKVTITDSLGATATATVTAAANNQGAATTTITYSGDTYNQSTAPNVAIP